MDEPHMIPEYMLGLEQLQANAAAQTEYFPVQAQDVHFQLYFAGEKVGAKLADEGAGVVVGVRAEFFLIPEHVATFRTE